MPGRRIMRAVDEFDEFRKRVHRDDYSAHVAAGVCAAAGFLLGFVFENPFVSFGITGCSLIAAGVFAIRGGKSAVTGIGARGSGGGFGLSWTTRELEDMPRGERAAHASLTGGWLIAMGALLLSFVVVAAIAR